MQLFAQLEDPDPMKWPIIGLCLMMIAGGFYARGKDQHDLQQIIRSPLKVRMFGLSIFLFGLWAGWVFVMLSLDNVRKLGPLARTKVGLVCLLTTGAAFGLLIVILGPPPLPHRHRGMSPFRKAGLVVILLVGLLAEIAFWYALSHVRR